MSSRQLRRVTGSNTLPYAATDSDDYEDFFTDHSQGRESLYAGLELSSESEGKASEASSSDEEDQKVVVKPKKNNKNNKKNHKKVTNKSESLDEIDKSIKEINAVLGAPPPAPPTPVNNDEHVSILSVSSKYLNAEGELRRLLGPDSDEEQSRRKPQRNQPSYRYGRIIIIPSQRYNTYAKGLSMSVIYRENDITYFSFDHSQEYQKMQKAYLQLTPEHYENVWVLPLIEELRTNVEYQLEISDGLFKNEQNMFAIESLERAIDLMQRAMHPHFNLRHQIRLDYKYLENRPFHKALLKYIYVLSNKACHRTALEVCKLLLWVDPSDPVAILLIIDVIAIRAREYEWLLKAIEYWSGIREAGFLFQIQYSKAFATYHLAIKKSEDLTTANHLLRDAILHYPSVILRIKDITKNIPAGMISHEFFVLGDKMTPNILGSLIAMYAKMIGPRLQTPQVGEWLNENIKAVMAQYDEDPSFKERVQACTNQRMSLYQGWPEQVIRHLNIIRPMSKALLDEAVPTLPVHLTREPMFGKDIINRYTYGRPGSAISTQSFLESLLPDSLYNDNDDDDDDE